MERKKRQKRAVKRVLSKTRVIKFVKRKNAKKLALYRLAKNYKKLKVIIFVQKKNLNLKCKLLLIKEKQNDKNYFNYY